MSVWFNPDRVFSYNALLNFVVGFRGVGKTYGCKVWAVNHFFKTGRKFIYLRRFKEEVNGDDLKTFFTQIENDPKMIGHEFRVDGRQFYVDGQLCGQALYLTIQQSKKSVTYEDYDTIIFDEFIIEKGYQHYLPNEPLKLFNFMDTVFRHRDNCRCICLANAINWSNPYFTFFKFLPMQGGYQVTQNGTVLLNVYENEEYQEMRSQSRFAQMVHDTAYDSMAIQNKFDDMSDDFIKARPKNGILQFNIQWKDKTYGVWFNPEVFEFVISNKINQDVNTICYTTKDYKPNMMLITDKKLRVNNELKRAFVNGYLFYEDMYIRNDMYDLFTLLGVR